MTIHRLCTRLQHLEQASAEHTVGVLHVWRLPDESTAEACARYEVDLDDYPKVQVHVWPGARVSSRLVQPPAPVWISKASSALADLEHRLHAGLTARRTPEGGLLHYAPSLQHL